MSPERERKQHEIHFEDVVHIAKETILKDGYHEPVLIMDGSKKMLFSQVPALPGTHDERRALMYGAGIFAARRGEIGQLRQVFFISEAWMSLPGDGQLPKMRPAEDPNRKEVLIISGLKIQGKVKYLKMFEMIRDKSKQLIDLLEVTTVKEGEGEIDVPLLEAFHKGFQNIFRASAN